MLSRSKEQTHKYRDDRDTAYSKMQEEVDKLLRMDLPMRDGVPEHTDMPILKDDKSTFIEANPRTQEQRYSDHDRQRDFARTTTDAVATLLLRLLQ